jgi:hypothetical protein
VIFGSSARDHAIPASMAKIKITRVIVAEISLAPPPPARYFALPP